MLSSLSHAKFTGRIRVWPSEALTPVAYHDAPPPPGAPAARLSCEPLSCDHYGSVGPQRLARNTRGNGDFTGQQVLLKEAWILRWLVSWTHRRISSWCVNRNKSSLYTEDTYHSRSSTWHESGMYGLGQRKPPVCRWAKTIQTLLDNKIITGYPVCNYNLH